MKFFWTLCCFSLALQSASAQEEFEKCGTRMMLEARRTGILQPKLKRLLLGPPQSTDSIVSPGGLFRIHFSTSGDNSVTLEYAEYVAREADAAFRFQCDTLGFPKPPFSFADSLWHIYISDLSNLIYGYTAYVDSSEIAQTPAGFTKMRAFIVIDNDYSETPTKGLDAARITIQHEFFHVIQFGSFGSLKGAPGNYQIKDINFIEMSSVWMEMISTPWVPDFLFFIDRYLANIGERLDNVPNYGYSQGIWLKYLEQRFGQKVIQETWENYSNVSANALACFDVSIGLHGSAFCSEYKRFGAELIETGRRYRGTSLPFAQKYPVNTLKVTKIPAGVPYSFSGLSAAHPASLNIVSAGFGEDTTFVTIARSTDFIDADVTAVTIRGDNAYTVSYAFPELFCDTLIEYEALKTKAFPVPFIISEKGMGDLFRIKASETGAPPISPIQLRIYTVSMKLVRHIEAEAKAFGGSYYAEWDGRDDTGAIPSSGMYIYAMEADGKTYIGKFPIIIKN